MSDNLIKQDIHFLDFPLWFQDKDLANQAENGYVWEDLEGFIYRAGYKPPIYTDLIILLAILQRSQRQNWKKELTLTRYELLQDCDFGTTQGYWYERIKESLERWMHVVVTFEGTFYNKPGHIEMQFHIIEHWTIEKETKKLKIRLSPEWIERIQHSTYFQMINFQQIKTLRSPLATRLYEILIKNFQGRPDWSCGAVKLAGKIPMEEKHPAHIIPKIKAAVNRINEKTDLQIRLEVRRPKRGEAVFTFWKLDTTRPKRKTDEVQTQVVEKNRIVDVPEEKQDALDSLVQLLPEEHRHKKTLRELLARCLRKYDEDYVKRNLLYTNQHAQDNYRNYLSKALKEDWGAGFWEDQQQKQETRDQQKKQAQQQHDEQQKQRDLETRVQERIEQMSPHELLEWQNKARSKIQAVSPQLLKNETFAKIAVHTFLRSMLYESLEAESNTNQ